VTRSWPNGRPSLTIYRTSTSMTNGGSRRACMVNWKQVTGLHQVRSK